MNVLTSETLTDIGGGATFYSTLVEVRKQRTGVCAVEQNRPEDNTEILDSMKLSPE